MPLTFSSFLFFFFFLRTITAQDACISTEAPTTTAKSLSCPAGWTAFQTNCYKYFAGTFLYSEALANCKALGSTVNLASIHSAAENSFVYNLIQAPSWIGLIRIGLNVPDFAWSDGTPFDYSSWDLSVTPPEPNNTGGVEYCTFPAWNDFGCNKQSISYVCEQPMS